MVMPNLDDIFSAEEIHSDKGYEVSTHEKQAEYAKRRNYHYTTEFNKVKCEWDDWKPIEDIV